MSDDEPATEGDRAWRAQMQETGELAERLKPPDDVEDDDARRTTAKRTDDEA